jgi:hypothetical protein
MRSPDHLQGKGKPYKLMRPIPVPAAEMIVETSVMLDVPEVDSAKTRLLAGQNRKEFRRLFRYSDKRRRKSRG